MMGRGIIGDLSDYGKKHWRLILLSVAAAVFCFGFQAFSTNIRIDTEELLNHPGTTLGWLTIGRYGLVLLKRLLGLSVHHAAKSGLLFLLFFCMGSNLLTFSFYRLSGKNEKYPYWIFTLLYGTSCIFSYQIYFSLQQAEIALAMLLLILAALLSVQTFFLVKGKANLLRLAGSTVLLVIGLGAYQALAAYYIAICIAFFLVYCWKIMEEGKSAHKKLTAGIVGLILQFCAAYFIYSKIAHTWFMATGAYMENQMGWGRLSVPDCIKNVLRTIKNAVIFYGPRNFSFYTIGALLICAVLVFMWRKKTVQNARYGFWFVLATAGLLLSPFIMTIYMGEMLVTRSQFALPPVAAFLGMFGIGILGRTFGKKGWQRFGVSCVLIVAAVQTGFNLYLARLDDVRYREDVRMTEQVLAALRETENGAVPTEPVIFVGYQNPGQKEGYRRTEMYGWSFYEWDYSSSNPTGATHRIDGLIQAYSGIRLNEDITERMKSEAVRRAEQMPDFPSKGAVCREDGYIVVRLSEIAERTGVDWW